MICIKKITISLFTIGILVLTAAAFSPELRWGLIDFFKPLITNTYIKFIRDKERIDADHVVTTLNNGMPIIVNDKDGCVCWSVRFVGAWDKSETIALNYLIKPGFKVIEAGGNFGVHTLRMSRWVGDQGVVETFEANPAVSKYLSKSVYELNKLKNVVVHQKGLGDAPKKVFLSYAMNNIGGGNIVLAKGEGALETEIVRLDDVFKTGKYDVLKMDTEGYEAKILQGAQKLLKRNPDMLIVMEWSKNALISKGSDPAACLKNLQDLGYKYYWRIGEKKGDQPNFIKVSLEEIMNTPYCDLVISHKEAL